jgi:hypothetical protein
MDMIEEQYTDTLRQWLEQAELVARHTKDPLAKTVYDYMRQHCLPYYVDEMGVLRNVVSSHRTTPKDCIGFLPLFEVDAERNPELSEFLGRSHIVGFFEGLNSMIVRAYAPHSDIWKGVLMLHLGYAALWSKTHKSNPQTEAERHSRMLHRLRDTHQFQNQWVTALGGELYEQAIQEGVAAIRAMREVKPEVSLAKIAASMPNHMVMYKHPTFGAPLSEVEEAGRHAQFVINSVFVYLEETNPREAQKRQVAFGNDFQEEMNARAQQYIRVTGENPL